MTINEDDMYPKDEDDPQSQKGLSNIADRLRPDAPFNQSHIDGDLDHVLQREDPDDDHDYDDQGRWQRAARQTRIWFRLATLVFLGCFLIGWPAGTMWAEYIQTGLFRFSLGFTFPVFLNMTAIPLLIFIIGHILSLGFRMAGKAEELERSANRLTQPEQHAASGVRSVGKAVKSEIDTLNLHLDEALGKLASVESIIRQQIRAIDDSASALEDGSSQSVSLVMTEREKLIELTENLNNEADAFAEAIAEKAKLGQEQSSAANARILGAEKELDSRLGKLEETANRALDAFERLSRAIEEKEALVSTTSANLNAISERAASQTAETARAMEENTATISAAQERLEAESKRLESLIDDQRERADRLADAISEQTSKLGQISVPAPETEVKELSAVEPVATPSSHLELPRKPLTLGGISTDEEDDNSADMDYDPLAPRPEGASFVPGAGISNSQSAASIKEQRQTKSWSDILAAADEPDEQPLTLANESKVPPPSFTEPSVVTPQSSPLSASREPASDTPKNHVISLVRNMQHFMLNMETQLYGEPQQATLVRFEGGERNIFANMLLRRSEDDVKNRVRLETARNETFEKEIYEFLANFDRLLEPATGERDSENLIDDYLGSPLGQVYLLTGSAMDYFS